MNTGFNIWKSTYKNAGIHKSNKKEGSFKTYFFFREHIIFGNSPQHMMMLMIDCLIMGNCCPGLFSRLSPATRQQDIKTLATMDPNNKNNVSKSESTGLGDSRMDNGDVSCDCETHHQHSWCCSWASTTRMATHSRGTQTLISFSTFSEQILLAQNAAESEQSPQVIMRPKHSAPSIRPVNDEEEINEKEMKFYEDISKYIHEEESDGVETTKVNLKRNSQSWSLNWKRLSGLDNINDEKFKSELRRRLAAKSRANVIGWQIISAKSAPKSKITRRSFVHAYTPELDETVKTEIYRRNLPLGLPSSIKTLYYDSDRVHGRLVSSRDAPLKIHADPVKKTGLLETRDGSLRRSYQIIREGLVPRSGNILSKIEIVSFIKMHIFIPF